ncbi:MAG TPA: DUF6084 family protein [Solirubrobacteraceae bacterium]|jgi:Family of unknown function (DUF6084)
MSGETFAQARIAPEFQVHDVTWVPDAAAPTLSFALGVTETSGREVFTIALTAQINIDPARRSYDAETREALVELFGPPERWAATTKSFVWTQVSTLVPSFTGETTFTLPVACTYDLELAAAKYLYNLPDGEAPLSFHFTGSVLHRGDAGQLQVVLIPWTCSADWRMPVATWREMMERHYPNGAFVRLHADTLAALSRRRARRGLPSYDACVADLLKDD